MHSEIRSALLSESSEYSYTNNNSKNINLRIGSLNCRSLAKPNQPTVSSEFIRFLRSQSFDLVTLQETHASDPETQQTLDMKFQAKSSIWSRHCGIVSLISSIVLSSSLISIDQRLIACTISHIDQVFEPFTIVTIYAPASPQPRREFYHHIMQLPVFSTIPRLSIEDVSMNDQSSDQPFNHRMIITGDFNYSPSFSSQYTNSTPQIPFRAAQRDW